MERDQWAGTSTQTLLKAPPDLQDTTPEAQPTMLGEPVLQQPALFIPQVTQRCRETGPSRGKCHDGAFCGVPGPHHRKALLLCCGIGVAQG